MDHIPRTCANEAFKHIPMHRAAFDKYEIIALRNVHLGDNNIIQAIGMGSITIETLLKDKINRIRIKNMFHVSYLHVDLLSVSKLVSNALKVQFNLHKYIVKSSDD